jgi:signal peptidase I
MRNTLQNGDFLIASKISYVFGNPARGDIVILNPPHQCEATSADYVKRVVGLPGDNIEIDADTSPAELLVQPEGRGPWDRVTEPYLPGAWEQGPELPITGSGGAINQVLHIPSGDYFVMGDNRDYSCDSRFFGLVSRNRILAKAILRIWPLGSFGGLGSGPTLVTTSTPAPLPAGYSVGGLVLVAAPLRRRRRVGRELARLRTGDPSPT